MDKYNQECDVYYVALKSINNRFRSVYELRGILLKKEYPSDLVDLAIEKLVKTVGIFEINTGAISRGTRKTPYPAENLLYILKKENAKIIVSSDSHSKNTLDCSFKETRNLLLDIGFKEQFALLGGEFKRIKL